MSTAILTPRDLPADLEHPHWAETLDFLRVLLPSTTPASAEIFLSILDDDKKRSESYIIQHEHPDWDRTRSGHGTLEECLEELIEENQAGHGIFVAVNAIQSGRRRKKENVERIRACFFEADNPIPNPPLAPSILVQSKNGQHGYFLTANVGLEESEAINKSIVNVLHADKACTDITRILRLPGFFHMKDPSDPFLIRLLHADPALVYSANALRVVFPPLPPRPKRVWSGSDLILPPVDVRIRLAKAFLERQEGVVRHKGLSSGSDAFKMCMIVTRGYDLEEDDDALEAMEDWNDRCTPPYNLRFSFSDSSLLKKIQESRERGNMDIGCVYWSKHRLIGETWKEFEARAGVI